MYTVLSFMRKPACVSAGAIGHGAKRSVGRGRSVAWGCRAPERSIGKTAEGADATGCGLDGAAQETGMADRQTASRPCAPQGASMSVKRSFFVRGEALQCPPAGLAA